MSNRFQGKKSVDAGVEGTAFKVLLAISFCHLLNDMIQSVIPSIYPMIKGEFGLTFAQIGIITFFLIEKFGVSVQSSQLCLFAFLAASAVGILVGGALGDKFGRKYVIWGSILGVSPFTLLLPYVGLEVTIVLAILIGLIISSAFSAIVVYATDLIPNKVGMIAGLFFGLSFGLGGIGSALFGWIADIKGIPFVFQISTVLPLLGIVAWYLPNVNKM